MRKFLPLLLAGIGVAAVVFPFLSGHERAEAAGPCGTTHDAVDGEEAQFLQLLQTWRSANVQPSVPLQQSGALNAAAAWFAEFQSLGGAGGGHVDNLGRTWVQRAVDCGYDPYWAQGSGEGIFAVAASGPQNIGPNEALAGITYPGSGVYIPSISQSAPAKCVGVAVRRNASGSVTAWVAVIAQFPAGQQCPGSTSTVPTVAPTTPAGSSPAATWTPSMTPSPTATSTPSPTPTPTQTPTPQSFKAFVPQAARD